MKEQNKTETKSEKKRVFPALLPCGAAMAVCACAAVFYHRAIWFGAGLILLAGLTFALAKGSLVRRLFPAVPLLVCGAPALFLKGYFPILLLFSIAFLSAAAESIVRVLQTRKEKGRGRFAARLTAVCLCVLLFASPLFLGWCPDPLFRFAMQQGVMAHTPAPDDFVRPDGVRVIADVEYPSAYPNNTMLLFLAPENRGTLFFIHGGGFVLGDKTTAAGPYFGSWLEAGYNVVSIDYVLAPQYRIDKQLIQCGEALRFFMENAPRWGVDPGRVVLAGESAGGCLSGLLAAASASPSLAEELGVPDEARYGAPLRGWISIGGLVDIPRFGETGDDLVSWAFNLMGVCAFRNPAYASSDEALRFSVLEQATADFPPAYISDGNRGTFTDQGTALAEKLRALGVRVETFFVPPEAGRRDHVFELRPDADPLAAENLGKTVAFVRELLP